MPSPSAESKRIRVVAVVGSDGAGKSTVATELVRRLRGARPCRLVYLGQSSGHIATRIAAVPILGAPLARYLKRKAERVHAPGQRSPGAATALVVYLLSCWRRHKFRRVLRLSRHGVLVVSDRYPQAEVPGFHFDGAGLAAPAGAGRLTRWLAAREQRSYAWMASHVPLVVLRLDVDLATACARKPDHRPEVLARKIAVLPQLRFHGARIVALDACAPLAQVLERALAEIDVALRPASQASLA